MKKCPISKHPIDVFVHSKNAIQVACPASHWMSSLFTNANDAYEFRETLDVAKQVNDAVRQERGGKVRLVGNRWMTEFMTAVNLDQLVAAVSGTPSAGTRRKRSSNKTQESPADAPTE